MPDAAIENVLVTNLKAYLVAQLPTRLTNSNVLIVPYFDKPPFHYTDIMVQIRYPEVYPYGQAGYVYAQKMTIDIAVFKRENRDPKKYWEALLTDLAEANLQLRKIVNGYDGGTMTPNGGLPLAIRLYDSQQSMNPRILTNDKGEVVKDCAWTAFRVWGMAGTHFDLFKSGDYDGS